MERVAIPLDLLSYQSQLKIRREGEQRYIFCPIRKKYLVLQPEELVRQLTLVYLQENRRFNKNYIHVERGLTVHGNYRRCDIIVYNQKVEPLMLVECKAPAIKLKQETFDQISQYNLALKVDFLLITNGLEAYCCKMDYQSKSYKFLLQIPVSSENG